VSKISSGATYFETRAASLSRVLWALVLMTLPVTSFRFMPFMGSGTYVRPLALYPLVLLLPVLLFRIKLGQIARPWPGAMTVLLAFSIVAVAATMIGATLSPLELRGSDFFDRALRAGVTLVIGVSFFAAAVWMNQSENDLRFSVRWLMVGLVAQLLWGAIQFVGLNSGHRKQLIQIQNLFSVRGLVQNKRISGFAFEPSWLAGQITALYLPWLVAGLLTHYRALSDRPAAQLDMHPAPARNPQALLPESPRAAIEPGIANKFQPVLKWIEPLLLVGGLAGILLTYSRSGLVIAFVAGLATFALAGGEALSAFWGWFRAGFERRHWTGIAAGLKLAGSRILLTFATLAILTGAAIFLGNKGYIAALFKSEKTDLFSYAVDVFIGPRLAYASAALQAYQDHPWTGVGLGASGFGIYQNMPDWILSGVSEIASQMSPASSVFPNPKNLFIRLLAETGLPGALLFTTFYLGLLAESLSLLRRKSQPGPGASAAARWLGTAGIFAWVAVVLQGFSQDSFAMPELWINLGLLAGAAGAFYTQNNIKEKQ
jgi:hypothetical protein